MLRRNKVRKKRTNQRTKIRRNKWKATNNLGNKVTEEQSQKVTNKIEKKVSEKHSQEAIAQTREQSYGGIKLESNKQTICNKDTENTVRM